jgi:hypothetical protein
VCHVDGFGSAVLHVIGGLGRPSLPLRSSPWRPILAKARALTVNAMTPLERALANFQRSILARDS